MPVIIRDFDVVADAPEPPAPAPPSPAAPPAPATSSTRQGLEQALEQLRQRAGRLHAD